MSQDLSIVLILLALAVVMFALNKPRMDAVALIMIGALPLSGILTVNEALSGFSDPAVILIALLFVIGEALARTGIVQYIGDWLLKKSNSNENQLLIFLMVAVAGVGAFMSSTGVVAIFIPVVLRIAKQTHIAAGRLMMPLSYAALLSGMLTLVATPPNLVVQSELVRHNLPTFSFFSFTPFGLPLLILAILYMFVIRKFLGTEQKPKSTYQRPHIADWVEEYQLYQREARIKILKNSPLIRKTLEELDLRQANGVNILAIERTSGLTKKLVTPRPDTLLLQDDILLLDVVNMPESETVASLCGAYKLEQMRLASGYFADSTQQLGMAQIMIPASSALINETAASVKFRKRFDLSIVGMKRANKAVSDSVADMPFKMGDILLVIGPWRNIRRLANYGNDIVVLDLPEEIDDATPAPTRAPYALIGLGVMIVLMVSGIIPNVLAALLVCLFLGLTRCIDFDAAYRSIHWQSLVLIAGMLPFSLALQKTGGITLATDFVLSLAGQSEPRVLLASLFIVTAILGLFISNTATAVLMAPVAISLAQQMGVSPLPFAMTVALAASTAFITPVSSPVNALVQGPGNFRFIDFVKFGVPFSLLTMLVTLILVPILLPF
ncbi:SLC13 family permease [Bartonella sp. HY038]|uniref:SLC13 family permease n=1 Tax=Bartonella sp. HY038 TaxID=2759660 RepID=UPI0015FBA97B|nr:SLC13 family permease [Bartonella sp. HY038]